MFAPELNKYDDAWHSEAEDKNEVKEMGIREREVDEVNEEVEKKEEEESEEITTVKTLKGEEVRMRLQDVPRDGHCLLHAVIVALDDSSDSEPPRLEQLMDYCYETATDNRGSAPELNKYDDAWHSEAEDTNEEDETGKRKREVDEEVDGEAFGEVDVVNEEVENKEKEVLEASEEITTVKTKEGEEVRMRLQDVPGDGHCLLHAVLVALEDKSSDTQPLRLERLLNYFYETAINNRGRYEMFLEEDDIPLYERYLDRYIRQNDFRHALGDIIPLILADCLGLVINIRQGDQWNQIVPQEGASEAVGEIFLRLERCHYQAYVRETEE